MHIFLLSFRDLQPLVPRRAACDQASTAAKGLACHSIPGLGEEKYAFTHDVLQEALYAG
jgi:hypothetical protein